MKTTFFHAALILQLVLLVPVSQADTFLWNGGAADSTWSTPGNWTNNAAPAIDGSAALAFSGNTRPVTTNTLAADTVFTGISLLNNKTNNLASFTLAGNRLVLGGALTTTASSPGTLSDTIALSLLLNAARTVTVNSAHHLTISGVIGETGGSQGLTKTGSGELTLTGANTYSGKTSLNGGRVYFNSISNIGAVASALGAPTTAENGVIDINLRTTYTGGSATSDRVFNFLTDNQFENSGSGTLTLTGGITGAGRTPTIRGSGNFIISGPIALGSGALTRTDGGTLVLSNPTNAFTGNVTINDGTISVDAMADAGLASPLGAGTTINIGQPNGTTGRFRYTGTNDASCNRAVVVFSQDGKTNGGIIESATAGKTLTLSGTVSVSAVTNTPTLQLTGIGNGVLSGVVSAGMRVTVNGSGTWTLAGANTYTGVTTVSSGTLLVNGSTAAASAVSVAAAGTLGGTGTVSGAVSLTAGAKLAPGSNGIGTLTLANGGASALTLNGNTVTCEVSTVSGVCDVVAVAGTLVLNGANTIALAFPGGTAPAGVYTQMTYAAKSGSGTLALDHPYPNATLTVGDTAVTLTITGGGTAPSLVWKGDGSANAWNTTADNWTPILYGDGGFVLFDDTGSASPAVSITPATVAPYSVTVNTSSKAYTFNGLGITGAASLIKNGTTAFTLNSTNTYSGPTAVNAGTLTLNGSLSNSTVSVAWGATFNENAAAVIAGAGAAVTNYGSTTFSGTNTYGGVTVVGVTGISNITLTANSPYALGSTAGGTVVNGGNASTENKLVLGSGVTVAGETLTLNPASGYRAALRFLSGGSATWDGDIVIANVNGPAYIGSDNGGGNLIIGSSSDRTVSGITGGLSFRGGGTVTVNSRINVGAIGISRDDAGTLILNSTGNVFSAMNLAEGTLRLGATNALPTTANLTIGKGSTVNNKATFDLNGMNQQVASLAEQHSAGGGGWQRITSVAPATLIVSNTAANTFGTEGSMITGAVSMVKMGAGTLALTGTNLTSGSFIVSNGTLTVSATGTFGPLSTNIVVAAGTLTLSNSVAIADSATVRIANGGSAKLNLAAGVNETVERLYYGDNPKRSGTFGATGSGAAYINDEHFSGTGILTVLRGYSGTAISIR